MKKRTTYLLLSTAMALAACSHRGTETDGNRQQQGNAALELYCKYADNHNLTVAYLGDLSINEKDIDAVMLQASDNHEWEHLCQDFNLLSNIATAKDTTATDCDDEKNVFSVGVGIETDFLSVLGLDSLTSRDQITEANVRKVSEYIAVQLRDIISNFQENDSVMPAATIVIDDGPLNYNSSNLSYDEYVNVIAQALTQTLFEEYFTKTDSISHAEANDPILDNAQSHGHSGYVTATDYKNLTIWLFFYDDQEECNLILTHIKEDGIINQ